LPNGNCSSRKLQEKIMARTSVLDGLIRSTLTDLEYELEAGGERQVASVIPNLKWKVYTDDSPSGIWRLDREIPPTRMDPGKIRAFENDTLKKLAPIVGPLATRVAIQRCEFDGSAFTPASCRVIEILSGNISICTHPRPPKDC
jgi:hypothetical protein